MEAYQKILTFFNFLIQKENQRILACKGLKAKLEAQKELSRLQNTKKILRLRFYDYEDFLKDTAN